jgi:parallel beta-helix repeat protein
MLVASVAVGLPLRLQTSALSGRHRTSISSHPSVQDRKSIRICDQFPGDTAGAQIAACIAALPASGGIAEASNFDGVQIISTDVFSGVNKSGELKICSATFKVSTPITIPSNWTIRGCGRGSQFVSSSTALPPLPESGSPSAVLYVASGAVNVVIQDIYVKGAYIGTGTSDTAFGIYVGSGTKNVQILNNTVTNNSWSGILLKGSHHVVQGNQTTHNAIDGIESFATDVRIIGNQDYDGAAASENGVACIEILPGSANVQVSGNSCNSSNHQGIVISGGGVAPDTVLIDSNVVTTPASRGIVDNGGSVNVTIKNNVVNAPRGSGALGHGIYLANTTHFVVSNNTVVHANTGTGPSGIQLDGTCDGGVVTGNTTYDNWVGLAIGGNCGTNDSIVVANNTSYDNVSGVDYLNSSTGRRISAVINRFGKPTTAPR